MTFPFRSVTAQDAAWITAANFASRRLNCELSFGNIFTWANDAGMQIANMDGTLICRYQDMFSVPVGAGRDEVLDGIIAERGGKFTLFEVSDDELPWLRERLGDIDISYDRRWSDYLYTSEKLASLTGKKLAAKRNHINAFLRDNEEWRTEEITPDNMADVIAFREEWAARNSGRADENFKTELAMGKKQMDVFFETGMKGLVLITGGRIVAYSFGEALSDLCFCVHAEKALGDVRGAYPLINREFVRRYCMEYQYVNREDDSGEEGLRRAKLSYDPALILHKYLVKVG